MCMVSNVYDWFSPRIPQVPTYPQPVYPTIINPQPFITQQDIEDLKKLIEDFKEAVEKARRLDELMEQPDCVDPSKLSLDERVRKIEEYIKLQKEERRNKK